MSVAQVPDNLVLSVVVPGQPRPQGSMQLARNRITGREFAKYSQPTVQHRNLVVWTLVEAWGEGRPALAGPVAVRCTFTFARPRGHYGTGRNADVLKASAPQHWHATMPDTDKLARLISDALTVAGVVRDDAQIVVLRGEKVWGEESFTVVEVWELECV